MSAVANDSLLLVTGASGFIGRRLCRQLQSQGYRVRAMLRRDQSGPWDERVVSDLAAAVPAQALQGVACVFHLAGKAHALSETRQEDAVYDAINSEGTRKLLAASRAAGVRHFVFFSSVKAMGEGGETCLDENADLPPETPYGKSKLAAEKMVLTGDYIPHPVVLRLSMVYGPTDKGNLPRMIEAIARGRFPPLPKITNRRSMIHVDDVIKAAVLAMQNQDAAGRTYILTDGQLYSTRQMYEWICQALGKTPPAWTVPLFALRTMALLGDAIGAVRGRRFVFDSDALDKLLGSACYHSASIGRELGFRPDRQLQESLAEIVAHLGLK